MRFGRRKEGRPPPGDYPKQFTEAFMRETLPTTSPAEAQAGVNHLRTKGWTEEELARKILPYMPRRPGGSVAVAMPDPVPHLWLARELPAMDRAQLRDVVDELERRGWPAAKAATTVLPHLLPKLTPADAHAILTGLRDLGMSEAEIDAVARGQSGQ
jgi:hypothetical protein